MQTRITLEILDNRNKQLVMNANELYC
jgi:hypothetical protein